MFMLLCPAKSPSTYGLRCGALRVRHVCRSVYIRDRLTLHFFDSAKVILEAARPIDTFSRFRHTQPSPSSATHAAYQKRGKRKWGPIGQAAACASTRMSAVTGSPRHAETRETQGSKTCFQKFQRPHSVTESSECRRLIRAETSNTDSVRTASA